MRLPLQGYELLQVQKLPLTLAPALASAFRLLSQKRQPSFIGRLLSRKGISSSSFKGMIQFQLRLAARGAGVSGNQVPDNCVLRPHRIPESGNLLLLEPDDPGSFDLDGNGELGGVVGDVVGEGGGVDEPLVVEDGGQRLSAPVHYEYSLAQRMMILGLLITTRILCSALPQFNISFGQRYEDALPQVVTGMAPAIKVLIAQLKNTSEFQVFQAQFKNRTDYFQDIGARVLRLSSLTQLPFRDLAYLQFSYEMFAFKNMCTSLVAYDPETGRTFHGRNLDYYFRQALRDTTIVVNYLDSDNKIVYSSLQLVGYLGINTAFRPGYFGLSLNERDIGSLNSSLKNIGKAGCLRSIALMQHIFESNFTYDEALFFLKENVSAVISPTYFIVSGSGGRGAVVSKDGGPEGSSTVQLLEAGWIVQGNLERGQPDQKIAVTDRILRQKGVSRESVTQVLGTYPVLNPITICSIIFELGDAAVSVW